MEDIANCPLNAVNNIVFDNVLDFVARHCVGVLFDPVVKSFFILGNDQAELIKRPEQLLDQPTIIYGWGGTGKTTSVMVRMQQFFPKRITSANTH